MQILMITYRFSPIHVCSRYGLRVMFGMKNISFVCTGRYCALYASRQVKHFVRPSHSQNTGKCERLYPQFISSIGVRKKLNSMDIHTSSSAEADRSNTSTPVTTTSSCTCTSTVSGEQKTAESRMQPGDQATAMQSEDRKNTSPNSASNNAEKKSQNRRNLQSKALSFLVMVDVTALSPSQQAIHSAHVQALQAGEEFYTDPSTGYQVMSRLAHLQRGDCCGNACRHCPYGQRNAPEHLRRHYNSAFYD